MSRDIKVRQVRHDVKALDRGLTAAEHMKRGYVRVKDQTGQMQAENQGSSESVAYAQDQISRTAESLAYHGGRQLIRTGEQFGRIGKDRISRGARSMKNDGSLQKPVQRQTANGRSIVQQSKEFHHYFYHCQYSLLPC